MEVAHGDINISLNDRDAMAGLDRVEAEFKAKMTSISRTEARARIEAETGKFDAAVDRVKARLVSLKAERAEVVVKANKDDLDRKIAAAELAVTRLNARKAEVKIQVQGAEKALAAEAAIAKAEADRQKAYDQYQRRRTQIERQSLAASKSAERAARLQETAATRAELNAARQEVRIASLRKEYARLTDQIEAAASRPTPFGREAKIKVTLDEEFLRAKLLSVKSELDALGGHPPVHIRVDTDEGFLTRTKLKLFGLFNSVRDRAENIGNIRINAGPISGTLRTIAGAVAILSPLVTSAVGGLTALVGVLGTGLVGAGAIAGGVLTGLGLNFAGVFGALKPAIRDFAAARAATNAYTTAVQKYGEGSKQAKKAQQEMNSTLKNVSPSARNAAIGFHLISTEWGKLTGATAKQDFGKVLAHGIRASSALLPGLARNSNRTMDIVSSRIDGMLNKLRPHSQATNMFDSLGNSANRFLGPALAGLQHLGSAFLHVGESAARLFSGSAGNGFRKWALDIEKATQPGAKLDAQIERLGHHAADDLHFFASLGRLLMTVLNGSADSGDKLVTSMSRATDSWNRFLKTGRGQKDMSDFFGRSVDDVMALAHALNPLIAAFVQWSNLLAPFTTGILQGISFVSRLVAGFTRLIGLGGPMATLGGTIGAIFAINKIGSFVGLLVRAVSLMKELGAIGTIKALGTGAFNVGGGLVGGARGAGATIAASMVEAGGAVAAEIRAAMIAGGAAAAAEEAAGTAGGGAVAGLEGAAGGAVGGGLLGKGVNLVKGIFGRGGGAAAGAEIGAATAATEGLTGAVGGLGLALAPETLGISALVAGAGLLAYHFLGAKDSTKQWSQSLEQSATTAAQLKENYSQLTGSIGTTSASLHRSRLDLHEQKKALDATSKGTQEHERAELSYNEALSANLKLVNERHKLAEAAKQSTGKEAQERTHAVAATERLVDAKKKELEQDRRMQELHPTPVNKDKQIADEKQLTSLEHQRAYQAGQVNEALNRQAAIAPELARAYRGLPELTAKSQQAVGALSRQRGGQNVATTIATKYAAPKNVQQVSSAATAALKSGISSKLVLKVVADTHSAFSAINQLSKMRLAQKSIKLVQQGGGLVAAMLQNIQGLKLSSKELRIIENGGKAALALIARLVGIKIPGKNVKLDAHDHVSPVARKAILALFGVPKSVLARLFAHDGISGPAHNARKAITSIPQNWGAVITATVNGMPSVNALSNMIAGINSKTVYINAIGKKSGNFGPAGTIGTTTRAEGGPWTKTHGGMYEKPTLLVGEESRPEYVIATNPAYKDANAVYLKEAANALGYDVTAAAKGKKPKKKKKGHPSGDTAPGLNASGRQIAALHVPDPYAAGAVPVDQVSEVVSKIESALSSEKHKLVSIKNQRDAARKSVKHHKESEHGKKGKALATARRSTHDAESTLRELERGINVLAHSGGTWKHVNYKSIPQLEADQQVARGDKARLERANQEIDHLNSVISTDQARLQNIATQYNRTGSPALKDSWNAVLGERRGAIGKLGGILSNAKHVAQVVAARYPSAALDSLIDSLASQESTTETAQVENETLETEGPAASKGPPTAEEFITSLGLHDQLATLNKDYALAQTNNINDNPNTPENEELPTIMDDLSASQGLQAFWEGILARSQAMKEPSETITEIANAVTSARSTYQGLAEQVSQDKGLIATNAYNDMINLSSARQELYSNFGSNFSPIWSQGSPSGAVTPYAGAFGQNAVAQGKEVNVNVTNHFSHPPADPHSWSNGINWELQAAI